MLRPLNMNMDFYLDHLVNPPLVVQEQKEEDMNYNKMALGIDINAKATETEHQRRHLLDGLRDARETKIDELARTFGLAEDEAPKTFKEFIARVKSGDIMYKGSHDEDYEHGSGPFYHIRWKNPKAKEDRAGYKAAKILLSAAYARAKDEIIVLPLESGLAAKRAFEDATFTS